MDIFAVIVIFFIAFSMLRGYLRGTFMCLLDLGSFILSIIVAVLASNQLGHKFYTTSFFSDVKKSITGIVNLNAILATDSNVSRTVFIENMKAPDIITNFVLSNNNELTYELLGISTFEEYIVQIFLYIIMRTIAFFIIFLILYFVIYMIKLSVIPYFDFARFGILDVCISVFLGAAKSFIIINLILLFIPALFVQFNYQSIYSVINDSFVLSYLYNENPLLKIFLNSQLY